MSLTFEQRYAARYQDILSKVAVGEVAANTRLEKDLSYGKQVDRFIFDFSGVQVRDESRDRNDRKADDVGDSTERLTINKEKYMGVFFHQWDKLQKRQDFPEVAGAEMAKKMKIYYDAYILNETKNANKKLDVGSLAGGAETGVPIALTTNNLANVVTMGPAILRSQDVPEANFAWIIDPMMTAIIEQFLIGKDNDMSGGAFKNGYVGKITRNMDVYESNNLTMDVVLGLATNPTAGDNFTIGTLTVTFVAAPDADGEVKIGATVDATRANLEAFFNMSGTGDGTDYYDSSVIGTEQDTLSEYRKYFKNTIMVNATNNDDADTLALECIGSGRLALSTDFTDGTDDWGDATLNTYMGKKKSIDVVRQQDITPDITKPSKNPKGRYLWNDQLWGQFTFADGAKKFLNGKFKVN